MAAYAKAMLGKRQVLAEGQQGSMDVNGCQQGSTGVNGDQWGSVGFNGCL